MNKEVGSLLATAGAAAAALMYLHPSIGAAIFALVLIPFLPEFRYNLQDAKFIGFLGSPVVFDGLSEG
jgi:Flp pilus assembly protein TadB